MKNKVILIASSVLLTTTFSMTSPKVEASSAYNVKVKTDDLRVRTGPSLNHKIVGITNTGQTFSYLGKKGAWTKVLYKGNTRYIYSSYLKKYKSHVAKKTSYNNSLFASPTEGRLTQGYGNSNGAYGYTFHNGVDLAAAKGTPVYASASGKVTTSKNSGAYGKHVMISHSLQNQKYVTVYAHMNSLSVKSGQTVSKGMKIGTVGNTGNSFGNHLHFEIHKNSYKYSSYSAANSVNPMNYL